MRFKAPRAQRGGDGYAILIRVHLCPSVVKEKQNLRLLRGGASGTILATGFSCKMGLNQWLYASLSQFLKWW